MLYSHHNTFKGHIQFIHGIIICLNFEWGKESQLIVPFVCPHSCLVILHLVFQIAAVSSPIPHHFQGYVASWYHTLFRFLKSCCCFRDILFHMKHMCYVSKHWILNCIFRLSWVSVLFRLSGLMAAGHFFLRVSFSKPSMLGNRSNAHGLCFHASMLLDNINIGIGKMKHMLKLKIVTSIFYKFQL